MGTSLGEGGPDLTYTLTNIETTGQPSPIWAWQVFKCFPCRSPKWKTLLSVVSELSLLMEYFRLFSSICNKRQTPLYSQAAWEILTLSENHQEPTSPHSPAAAEENKALPQASPQPVPPPPHPP